MFLPVLLGIILVSSSLIYAKKAHKEKLFFTSIFCFSLACCEIIATSVVPSFLLGPNMLCSKVAQASTVFPERAQAYLSGLVCLNSFG